ncbi:hypothetical protein C1645_747075 [Glomus cerebriforme]|uniref:HMG box domain-containing protein n=1 Tax=Glomus cerebriforme TaxID=658196 RepID=A0A397TXI5_9GLOM|nr:hypothetical protein C1645_747075 [Glomus cerebriforme]
MSFESISFIDSQNNNDAILNLSLHEIRLPFPPPFITVADFINKRETSSRIFRKSPNAFFIYRKAFTNYLTLLNYKLTMIDVSKLVSNYWKNESKEIKDGYAKIAKEIDIELKEKRKHDKKCPVIWKIDKKSKKQKRISRRNLKNNNSTNNSETMFELQKCSVPLNEPNQKILRSCQEMDSHTSLESSPSSISSSEFPGFIQNFVNYDNSCESQSNESEEENYDCQPVYNMNTCDQNLNQIYYPRLNAIDNSPEYNFISYDINNLFVQYNWGMSNPCINDENLACQQGNGFH